MTATTLLLLLLSVLLAAGLSYYQYLYKNPSGGRVRFVLSGLRFLTVLAILLLLINPRIERNWYETVKTPLVIAADNSESVKDLSADKQADAIWKKLRDNARLSERFDLQPMRFADTTDTNPELDFKGKQTDIRSIGKELSQRYRNQPYATVLITDGNQTRGNDYLYQFDPTRKVFPVILGDTTPQTDLRIERVNVNKYAFLKNKFPVEVFLNYSGKSAVRAHLDIRRSGVSVAGQTVSFSPEKRSAVVQLLMPADKSGLQVYRAVISSDLPEKNKRNNVKDFAVEVMDQRSEILIVSAINHPDLGALKRSIETNAQRHVTLAQPTVTDISDYNLVILYQPTAAFSGLMDRLSQNGPNNWIITGNRTDFNLLNAKQKQVEFRMSSQKEYYQATPESGFNLFIPEELPWNSMPPLEQPFGNLKVTAGFQTLLGASVRNVATGAPLLGFWENNGKRSALLLGEGLWKWRLQSYVELRDFKAFDRFLDKTVQYLVSDNRRKALLVNHERFYDSGEPIEITAQFFNKNYEPDPKARLFVELNRKGGKSRAMEMLRSGEQFKLNLENLEPGTYDLKVRERGSNAVYNGTFELLGFDIEKQFVNPDYDRLRQLAQRTGGKAFFPDQEKSLVDALLSDASFVPVEKKVSRRVPLIDSIWLLVLLGITLAAEWFIRKYNGLL